MRYTKENIVAGIYAKIDSLDNISDRKKNIFKRKLPDYPKEIEQNVLEWINDLPLTDVDCHGESIIKVMKLFNLDNSAIPYLIKNFIDYKESNFRVYRACYGTFGDYEDQIW